jgi:hypothetical protein
MVTSKRKSVPIEPGLGEPSAADFTRLCEELFGEGWRRALSEGLRIHYATVMRYQSGELPVPRSLWLLLHLMQNVDSKLWRPMLFVEGKIPETKPPGRPKEAQSRKRRRAASVREGSTANG